jgi:outer membrane protein OmpA-like peptidoglycan-associated protein
MPDKSRSFSYWKIALIILAVLVILVAIAIPLLPQIANRAIVYTLQQQGYTSKVDQLDIDLLDGRLVGKGITAQKGAGEKLSLDHLEVVIDWQALSKHQLQLLNINIEGLQFDIGRASAKTPPVAETSPASAKGNAGWLLGLRSLALKNSRICFVDNQSKPCLHINKLSWQGKADFDSGATTTSLANLPLQLNGNLAITGLSITAVKQQPVLKLGELSLKGMNIDSLAKIQLNDIHLQQFSLPRNADDKEEAGAPEYIKFASLGINKANITELKQITVSRIKLAGLGMDVIRQNNGEWQIVNHLQSVLPQQPDKPANAPASQSDNPAVLPQLSIGQLSIEKSENIAFEDRTLPTPFAISLQKLAISLKDLDSQQPNQPTGLKLDSRIEDHGKVTITGDIYPFRDSLTFKLQGEANAVDLRPTKSYLEKYLGYTVKSGQLTGDLSLQAASGKLNGLANVELEQFILVAINQEKADELEQQLGAPLNSALTLLREKNKSIHLKIPISGDINDPKFNTDDAISQILTRAVITTVKTYYADYGLLTAAYGQYGVAVLGATKLYGFLTKLRFNDVTFETGQDALNPEQKTYLDNLARMLASRPEVHLTLCGYVTRADLLNQESWLESEPKQKQNLASLSKSRTKKLLRLALERAEGVKDYLLEKGAIEAKRLIICEPQYDAEADTLPRVEISI